MSGTFLTGFLTPCLLTLAVLVGAPGLLAGPPSASEPAFQILSHELTVELSPGDHHLTARDRLIIRANKPGQDRLAFTLNPRLDIRHVRLLAGGEAASLAVERGKTTPANVTLALPTVIEPGRTLILEWDYAGTINEPPREPRHLRFVTPSETAGHIGLEGVYLSGETLWYPDQEGSLPTYRLTVTVPQGWETVSHGRQIRHESTVRDGAASVTAGWEVPDKTEALTLVANRFVKDQRDWQGIELATYLFPEDARLSEEYLEATARYLALYTSLLGPYPFPKFAVVENFFASGLGMPSFTLLGSGVIKRHYVQPYALGHEIVHSWFGNSVFNDSSRGNWVEGLTTYLANYYYEELKGTPEQARDQRRLMLLGYAVHVRPDDDYPVGRFTHKSDQTDNAIGYQKAAMIFHMLRREVGEAAFWQGIKRLVAERTGTYATWQDLSAVFSRAAGRDLGWFFTQWVDRAGAPMLRIAESHVTREAGPSFAVEFTVAQTEPLFRLKLPLSVLLADGREQNLDVEMQAARQSYRLSVPGQPVRLRLDPESAIFRRLSRSRIPAMLNLFVTDSRKIVVTPEDASNEDRQPYKELADRVIAQSQQARAVRSSDADGNLQDASVLVLGPPHVNQAAAWAVRGCGDQVRLGRGEFTIADRTFREPDQALLVSCRHPDNPQHVVTLFYGHSPAAAAKVGRLLFFYGWQSYLVFQDGKIIARGDFPAPDPDTDVAVTSDK